MHNLLCQKEYRNITLFYAVIVLLILADIVYGFTHPEHYIILAFFAIFRVAELYQIKKFVSEKTYRKIFWIINIISVVGTIYFLFNNSTEYYNALIFFVIGAANIACDNKELQLIDNTEVKAL